MQIALLARALPFQHARAYRYQVGADRLTGEGPHGPAPHGREGDHGGERPGGQWDHRPTVRVTGVIVMMVWFDHDVSGWGLFAMSAGMIAFWALIITAAVLLFRTLGRATESTRRPSRPSPEQLLAERFARGDEEDYRRRLDALHASSPPTKH